MATVGSVLEASVRTFGRRPALLYRPLYRTETWSYADLWERSGRVVGRLRTQGIAKGDRVVIWAPNSPWWVAAYLGCLRLGVILVPLDLRGTADFVERVITQTEPRLAIVSRLTAQGWTHSADPWIIEDLERILADQPSADAGSVADEDIAEVIFTSGTTGDPKGVILTHGNITANLASALKVVPTSPDFRLLSLLPLSHMFEQTVGLLLPLACGASVYYPISRQSTMLFRDLQSQGITTILAVPQVFSLLMAGIEREVTKAGKSATWDRLGKVADHLPMAARRVLFRSVHTRLGGKLLFLVSGGAPLEAELVHKWARLGLPMIQGYGATEAAPILSGTMLHDLGPGTVGRAVPSVEIRIAEDGEVLARGPNITPGYWKNPQATADAFSDGWYKTGDLGQLDDAGRLRLRGRKKDLIVLANGQNVYPADLENALRAVGGLIDAAVVGLPSPQGARVHAVLLLDTTGANPSDLVRTANAQLAAHQQIQDHSIWPEADFPRTHTLKVKKHEVLRALLNHQETAEPPAAGPVSETNDASPIRRLIAEASGMPAAELTDEATLGGGCGLDSLSRVELLAAIETELDSYLDESRVGPDTTVGELEAMVTTGEHGTRPVFPKWPLSPAAGAVRAAVEDGVFALMAVMAPAKVSGLHNLTGLTKPVLFAANHGSHMDSPVLIRALPKAWRKQLAVAAAADYFFTKQLLGRAVALVLNAFPFSREGNIRPTIEHCAWLLDHDWSILIFPEGTRSATGEIGTFKAGAGLLAVELGVPVVPVRLTGVRELLPKGRALPRPGKVKVRFGPALRFEPGIQYPEAAAAIEAAVRAL
jgi:long-chain acyl-CoA synthetase